MEPQQEQALLKRLNQLESELELLRSDLNQALGQKTSQSQSSNVSVESSQSINPVRSKPASNAKSKKFNAISFENMLGGNIIGKLGFLTLILTSAWFVKLAIDYHWINASARIMLGVITGYSLIGLAFYFAQKGWKVLWPVSAGSGYAILYIAIYAAWYFYDFFGLIESFSLLFILTMLVTAIAFYTKSEPLYIFSLIGAILVPLIHSTGENSYRFMFSYLTLLHLVYFIIGFRLTFRTTGFILWAATILISSAWAAESLDKSSGWIVIVFILAITALLLTRLLFLNPGQNVRFMYADPVIGAAALLFTFILGLVVYFIHYPAGKAIWFLVMLLLASGFAFQVLHLKWTDTSISGLIFDSKNLWLALFWLVLPMLAIAGIYLVYDANWWVAGLVAFASAWLIMAARFGQILLHLAAILVWLIILPFAFFAVDLPLYHWPIINERFLVLIMASSALLFSWYCWHQKVITFFRIFWPFVALPILIIACQLEIHDLIEDSSMRNIGYSLVLVGFAVITLGPGFIRNSAALRYAGLAVTALLILKFYTYDISQMKLVYRILLGLVSGVALVIFSVFYQRFQNKNEQQAEAVSGAENESN